VNENADLRYEFGSKNVRFHPFLILQSGQFEHQPR
jgi:hypothetical protein